MRNSVWFCTRSEWACSPIGRPPTSPIHSVRYWIGYSRLGMLLDMVKVLQKIFFNNESHFMSFLSALDRNTYFSHKFFTVISNAIVYERDFSRKTSNLYLFFCDVVKELFIVRWSFYMTASKTQPYTKCFGKSNGFTCINVPLDPVLEKCCHNDLLLIAANVPRKCQVRPFQEIQRLRHQIDPAF